MARTPKPRDAATPRKRKPRAAARKRKTVTKRRRISVSHSEPPTERRTLGETAVGDALLIQKAEPVSAEVVQPAYELQLKEELSPEAYAAISDEKSSILSTVRDLEKQVDTAFQLKRILEAELGATQEKLTEEMAAHTELETQVASLSAQAARVEQLREDISFAEQERDKHANTVLETQHQFELVTEQRDSFAEQLAEAEAHIEDIKGENTALEAQVMNLKDKIADIDSLLGELAEMTKARREVSERAQELSRELEAAYASNEALATDLANAHAALAGVRDDVKEFRAALTGAEKEIDDLRIQLEDSEATRKDLLETSARLEKEKNDHEATKHVLEALRTAVREIRNEAARTSGRLRKRLQVGD